VIPPAIGDQGSFGELRPGVDGFDPTGDVLAGGCVPVNDSTFSTK